MIFRDLDEEEKAELMSESFVASMYLSAIGFDVDGLHNSCYTFESDDMDIFVDKRVEQRPLYFWASGFSSVSTTNTTTNTTMFEIYMHYRIDYIYRHPSGIRNLFCRRDLYTRQSVETAYLELLRDIYKGIEIIKKCIGIVRCDFTIEDSNVYDYFTNIQTEYVSTPEYNKDYSNLFIDEFDSRFIAEFEGDEHVEVDRCYASDRVQFRVREPTRIKKQIYTMQGQLKNRSPCHTLIQRTSVRI